MPSIFPSKRWMTPILGGGLALSLHAAEVISNGNFETGDFTGWTVGIVPTFANGGRPYFVNSNGNGWVVSNSSQGSPSISPASGYSAFNGFDGGIVDGNGTAIAEGDLQFFLNQSFTKSGTVTSATLSFTYDINGGPNGQARVFSVQILNSSDAVVGTAYSLSVTSSGQNVPLTPVNIAIDSLLNSLPDDTYKLNFSELIPQYYTGPAAFMIDNISLDISSNATPVPEASTWAAVGVVGLAALSQSRRSLRKRA